MDYIALEPAALSFINHTRVYTDFLIFKSLFPKEPVLVRRIPAAPPYPIAADIVAQRYSKDNMLGPIAIAALATGIPYDNSGDLLFQFGAYELIGIQA